MVWLALTKADASLLWYLFCRTFSRSLRVSFKSVLSWLIMRSLSSGTGLVLVCTCWTILRGYWSRGSDFSYLSVRLTSLLFYWGIAGGDMEVLKNWMCLVPWVFTLVVSFLLAALISCRILSLTSATTARFLPVLLVFVRNGTSLRLKVRGFDSTTVEWSCIWSIRSKNKDKSFKLIKRFKSDHGKRGSQRLKDLCRVCKEQGIRACSPICRFILRGTDGQGGGLSSTFLDSLTLLD